MRNNNPFAWISGILSILFRGTCGSRKFVPQLFLVRIQADGKLDEKVWEKAAVFTDLQNTADGRKIQDEATELRMFFDEKNVIRKAFFIFATF